MKTALFAVLIALLLSPCVRADDQTRVRVQFTYVDTSLVGDAVSKLLPPPHMTSGNALAFFTRKLTKGYIRHKILFGPDVTTAVGARFAFDQTHTVPEAGIGRQGADLLIGPRLALTATIVKSDLVSVVLSIHDQEIVGPVGYWLAKPAVVEADSWPIFKAHSGSTVFLGGVWSSDNIERFTFATVTILSAKATADAKGWRSDSILSAAPPDTKKPSGKPAKPGFLFNSHVKFPVLQVRVIVADVSAAIVPDVENNIVHPNHIKVGAYAPGLIDGEQQTIQGFSYPRLGDGKSFVDSQKLSVPFAAHTTRNIQAYAQRNSPSEIHGNAFQYKLAQTLVLQSRRNQNGTWTVKYHLGEHAVPKAQYGFNTLDTPLNIGISDTWNCHDGETKFLRDIAIADGLHHLIFITVKHLAPEKK